MMRFPRPRKLIELGRTEDKVKRVLRVGWKRGGGGPVWCDVTPSKCIFWMLHRISNKNVNN